MRSYGEVTELLETSDIVSVCEANEMPNVGDYWSSIGRTVEWISRLGVTMSLYEAASMHLPGERSPIQGKLVIVGGGGLVGPGRFESAIEAIVAQRPAAIVIWGIGHNYQDGVQRDPTTGWRRRVLKDGVTRLWPEWLACADAVAVRDWDAGLPWVPCSSCMLPVFEKVRDRVPEHDFVVLNHYEQGIDTSHAIASGAKFRHLTNNTEDLISVVAGLATGRVVVSNSYHALYWAHLLGRGAVAVAANSTRFRGFRWPVVHASQSDWLNAVPEAVPYPKALDESRDANIDFSARIENLARSLGLLSPTVRIDPAAGKDAAGATHG